MRKRLFIVSNRLPVTVDAAKEVQQVSGGLITAIKSYLDKKKVDADSGVFWAGVPGCNASTWFSAKDKTDDAAFTYLPVFVPGPEYEGYYNGYSNSVLWPLFHYFPSYAEYNAEYFNYYNRVNGHFAEILMKSIHPKDVVWIHDYHLLPLAALLRKQMPDLTIGFFLHIPFPSFEIFRLLPRKWQHDVLKGLLGADLIGFHTIDYASHFLQSTLMVLGLDNDHNIIHHDNRLIKVDVFPISINFEKFHDAYDNEQVIGLRQSLQQEMNGRKIIFSIDRQDYTGGIYNGLKAYEYFLQQNPSYHNKVVFIIVIDPSGDHVSKHAERKRMIDELISKINSQIGNDQWMPVIVRYNSLQIEERLALYTSCHLALITPLRDGMNLVSKEFVASRKDKKGVLIISEMAGAARELTGALTINPNDILEMAEKIREGLEISEEDQALRLEQMQKRIASYDIQAWGDDFVTELHTIKQKQESFQIRFLDGYSKINLFDAYRNSRKRLFLLNYDGTLVSFSSNPELAVPGLNLVELITDLSAHDGNDVFITSGRSKAWLEKYFGALPVNLIAEHGASYKLENSPWISQVQAHDDWKQQVQNVMEMYVRRCAGSFTEEKDFSMAWHYRNVNMEQGKLRASELLSELNKYIRNWNLQVLMGNKIVEVKQQGISKDSFIKKVIERKDYDYIFAAGDDRTDEDLFRFLANRQNTFTIKVGIEASYAQYNLQTPQMVVSLLEGMNHLYVPAGI